MPIFDVFCETCNVQSEVISAPGVLLCPHCNQPARRLWSAGNVDRFSERPDWIRSITDVIAPDDPNPHAREFRNNANRENYSVWLKSTGMRHLEPGEKPRRPEGPNMDRVRREVFNNLIKRRRIEI